MDASIRIVPGAATGENYAAAFVRRNTTANHEVLCMPEWTIEDWRKLLATTTVRPFKSSDVLIQRGVTDRALYFVAAGTLEVGVTHFDGVTISPLARIEAGSVIGEQSFFDGQPRSANVWAVTDGVLLRWEYESYKRFGAQSTFTPH